MTEFCVDPIYENLEDIIDPNCGVMKSVYRYRSDPAVPPVHLMCSRLSVDGDIWVGGMNVRAQTAKISCICEGMERYSGCQNPDTKKIIHGTELDFLSNDLDCMRSKELDYYTDGQYLSIRPCQKWLPTTMLSWSKGSRLGTEESVYIPNQFVYLQNQLSKNEPPIIEPTSSGLACHRDLPLAQLAGLREVIERDALMIFWLRRLESPRFTLESLKGLDPEADKILYRVQETAGLELTVLDITTDIRIPVILCILRNCLRGYNVASVFSAAADINPTRAFAKALNEVLGTYSMAHRLKFHREEYSNIKVGPTEWDKVKHFNDHVAMFGQHDILQYIGWIDKGPEVGFYEQMETLPDVLPMESSLNTYVDRLKQADLECLCVDITSPEVREIGFRVVKSIVPGAVPINSDQLFCPINCKRLETVPFALKIACKKGINIIPHPYP